MDKDALQDITQIKLSSLAMHQQALLNEQVFDNKEKAIKIIEQMRFDLSVTLDEA